MLITIGELRRMNGQEGLILQGCGGNEQQWVDGINELFTLKDILLDGTTFKDVKSFCHEGLSNLLFSFEAVKLDMGKLAAWRIQSHGMFGGTWVSDYVPNRLGGFIDDMTEQKNEEKAQEETIIWIRTNVR